MTATRHKNPRDPRKEGFLPSYSFLKSLDSMNPRRALYERLNREPDKQHQIEGKLIEALLFDPESVENTFVVGNAPKTDTQDYRFILAWYGLVNQGDENPVETAHEFSGHRWNIDTLKGKIQDGFFESHIQHIEAEKAGKRYVDQQTYDNAAACAEYVSNDSPILDYVKTYEIEPQLITPNGMTKVRCIRIPDMLNRKQEIVKDLKTGFDISPEAFARRWGPIHKYGYLPQLAAYMEGAGLLRLVDGMIEISGSAMIFSIEKKAPYGWKEYVISSEDLIEGYNQFSRWCAIYQHVSQNDLWNKGYQYGEEYELLTEWNGTQQVTFIRERVFPELTTTQIY